MVGGGGRRECRAFDRCARCLGGGLLFHCWLRMLGLGVGLTRAREQLRLRDNEDWLGAAPHSHAGLLDPDHCMALQRDAKLACTLRREDPWRQKSAADRDTALICLQVGHTNRRGTNCANGAHLQYSPCRQSVRSGSCRLASAPRCPPPASDQGGRVYECMAGTDSPGSGTGGQRRRQRRALACRVAVPSSWPARAIAAITGCRRAMADGSGCRGGSWRCCEATSNGGVGTAVRTAVDGGHRRHAPVQSHAAEQAPHESRGPLSLTPLLPLRRF